MKLLLAAIVTLGVATTGVALATASAASATATPVIANVNANYSLLGTGMPRAFTGTTPANQTDATLTAAVTNPSTATTLSFAAISQTYNFSPRGDVDVYAACSNTGTGVQSPSYVFAYTGLPFTVSGTTVSGGTSVTGVSLVYTNPACSSTTAIPSGEVYQTGAPEVSYAQANVTSGLSSINTASLTITSPPPAVDGWATVDPTTGQVYMTPEPTASGQFSLTYAYCVPGVTLTSDPSGLSDGNCASATVTYVAAQHCELMGENVTVSISSSDIYQAICSSTVAPSTVVQGQTFTYDTIPGTSVIPVEQNSSIGNTTIQYADNFVSIVPVPAGVTYVPGTARAVGGDPVTRGQATVQFCTAPRTGCDGNLTGNYKTTYPYIELELAAATHIAGGSLVTLPYVEAQFRATGASGTQIGMSLSEFRLSTQVDIPIIGSNTAPFDGYPTSCGSPAENTSSAPCSSSTTPPYLAPTFYPFAQIVPGVTALSTPAGAPGGTDAGGTTVSLTGAGFSGATAVNFGSTPATSFTVNSNTSITATAPPGTDGTVDVTVVSGGATSGTSVADNFTYSPSSAPDTPTGIAVTPGDGTPADGAAVVSWSPSFGEGSAVTGYSVTATDNTTPANGGQTCATPDGSTTTCSLSGLTDGDSYTFAVTATNAIGTSAAGTVTVNEGAPSAPTGVSGTAGQASSVVSFSPPATSGDGSAISSYTVTAIDATTPANGGQTATGSSSPVSVTGLTNGDSYTFAVTATNASGTSLAGTSAPVTPIGKPIAPTGVAGTSNANASSVVTWSPSASNQGAAITSYVVTASDSTTPANGGQTCTYTIPTGDPVYSCTVSGLTNGDSYTFTVAAVNSVGTGASSAPSAAAVPSTTPSAPTAVTAAPNTAGGVVVSWTPGSSGGSPITSYTVTSNTGSFTCTATAPATSCTVTGTTIGTSYTYTVKATNVNGTSAASAASASTKTTSLPAAPTAVSGTGQSGQVTVTFTGDTTTAQLGGSTISGYTATATDVTNPGNGGQTGTALASPVVVTGLTNGDVYTFTVHATTPIGNSPESAASGPLVPGSVPTPPLNVTAANVSPGGNAQVSWNPPASPGGTITQYTVTSSTGSKTCTYTGPFGAGETDTCQVSGLTIGTSYTYTVTATNQSGIGPASAASNAVVSSTVPSAPTSPSVSSTGNQSATVAFTGDTTTATEGGIAITGYTVTAIDATTPANGGETATGLTSPITVSGLTNGDSYTFTVTASNANGAGAASVATAAVNPGRPSAPTAVVSGADASSQTTLDVTWAASTSPDGTSPITGYTVTSSPGSFTCTTTGATTCNVSGLTAKTAYTFTVTATNQFGTSPASAASTSQNAGYPGIPTGVTVAQVSPIGANSSTASINVSWTVPNNGGAALTTETATSSSGSKTCTDTTHLTAGQTASCTMAGLTTGTSYTVSVKGTNANGTGSASAASAAIVPVTLPAAPTALVAATGNNQETVSFTGDTTASTTGGSAITGYTVTSTPGSLSCSGTATSCTVTGLTNGTSYTFTATATTAVGTSVASAASAALSAGAPNPPTGVVAGADASSSTTMDVSWTAATSPDGTSPITGYTVTSTPGSFTCTTTGATTCNVSGLTSKTAYTFKVTATNAFGTSVASAASTSQNAGYPGIPTGAHAVLTPVANASTGQVTVSWTVPNNGGSALTSQTATSSSGSKTCTDNTHITAGQTATCNVTGLTNGTSYTFTVKDVNANGTGTASAASNAVTVETQPLAPTSAHATASNQGASVAFTAPSTTNSGAISSYTVTATDTTTPANGGQTASGATSPITVSGLTNGDAYTFTVTATGADGTGPASAASASVTPATVPDAPTGVTATGGPSSASVAFTAPFNEGSAITGYTVTATDTTTPSNGGQSASGATSPVTVSGLTNGDAYTFTVVATNGIGTGAASAASSPVTPAAVPDAPTGVSATAGAASASVSFTPGGAEGSAITGYTVTATDTTTAGNGGQSATGTASPISVGGLTNGDAYIFTVTATNGVGTGAASAASAAVTPGDVPGAPTGVSATPGASSASVAFTAPSSNGSAITGYTVTATDTTTLANGGQTASGASSPISVGGLTNGDAYTFTVTATNGVGTGAASAASSAVTPADVPDAPTGVSATAGAASASVSFTPGGNEGSAITGYTVTATDTTTPANGGQTASGASSPISVGGLTNGDAYTFTVTATNGVGTGAASAASSAVSPSDVPDAPTAVTASALNHAASVAFTAPSSEGSAISSYSVTAVDSTTPANGGQTATGSSSPVTVSGLTNGDSYTFTVTATNGNGAGPASAASNAVVPVTVPDAPTGVSATGGDRKAMLTWIASNSEGSPVTSYTVTALGDGGGQTCTTPDGSTTSCTVTGLTNGTPYTFTVTATNANGTSAASAASSAVTPSTVPDAPTGVSATAGDQSASVSFTAANDEGSAVTSYTVTATDATTPANGGQTASGASSPISVGGLTNGDAYTFTVVATNGDGTGAASAASNSVTPASVPDAPTGVSATAGPASASVAFTAPADNGSAITGYTVTAVDTTTPANGGQTASGASSPVSVGGLTNGDAYTFTVVATNGIGDGAASAASSAVTPADVPDAPTGVSATAGASSASVSFTPGGNEGSTITGFTVTAVDTTTAGNGGQTASGASSPISVGGLTNGDAYTFTVTATNGIGTGAASAASSAVTPASAPDAPTGVSATAGDRAATVSWTASNNEGSAVTSYLVTSNHGQTCTTATTSCMVSGLTNGTAYTFTVTATNALGTSAVSSASSAVTPVAVPDAPTGVSAAASNRSASVSWTAAASQGSPVTSYTVTSSGGQTCTTATTSCTVSGLTNGTAYTFTVTATNALGTGLASAPSSAVTPSTVPDAPTGVSATAGASSASVAFTAPNSQGSAITSYTVTSSGGQTASGASSPITVSGLTNGTAYTFTVTATNADGTGAASSASSAVTPSSVPDAPTGVTATGGNASATVSWTAAGSEGSAITSYTVLSSTGKTCTTAATTCTVTGLTNNVAVTFTVTARNANGIGAASSSSNSVVPSANSATITSPSSAVIAAGKALNVTITTGGTPTATLSVVGLPSWLTFTPATLKAKLGTAKLTGTGPAGGGNFTFTIHANNGAGPDTTQVYSVHVLGFSSPAAAAFTKGAHGSFTITTTGSVPGVALSATVSSHLGGLTFHDNGDGTATLSGTPTPTAKTTTVTVKATEGSVTLSQYLAVTIG